MTYRRAALAAAGVEPPTAGWTYNDLANLCARLQAALTGGKMQGVRSQGQLLRWILPRIAATAGQNPGAYEYEGDLWAGFVLGHGGALLTDGRVTIDSDASARGMEAGIDLFRLYGNADDAPAWNSYQVPLGVALSFCRWPEAGLLPDPDGTSPVGYARFPRMPVRPVVPATAGARGVEVPRDRSPLRPGTVPDSITAATIRYLLWRYQPAQQDLFATGGVAPVINDAQRQTAFWHRYGIDLAAADIVVPADFIHYGSALPLHLFADALADPSTLQAGLHQYALNIQAAMAKANTVSNSAQVAAAASAAAERASIAAEFGVAGGSGS